ncbi:PTS system, 3-keto-L-gulonate/L-ascorbate specific IIA component (PtxA) [Ruminococcaceae bacterium BL-6]|nr:PTS system, 3-keto-L-gulonate/L-ascorbate specific IIA component (PtxA) [Ruminococcaceae bacterium BL-6]
MFIKRRRAIILLREIYEKKHYLFCSEPLSWEESIRKGCEPLRKDGTVDETYAEEIIACIRKHGPYIVILPGIALPHSTEKAKGAHATAVGFMKTAVPVRFEEGNPAKDAQIFFTLSSTNPDEHLDNMQKLYSVLTNENALERLKKIEKPEELLEIDGLFGERQE